MGATRLEIHGLPEFYAALRQLTPALAAEGGDVLVREATAGADHIRAAYPQAGTVYEGKRSRRYVRTGGLAAKVRVDQVETSRAGASVRVVSGAPHAHLYEFGTARGGRPHPTFVPEIQRARKRVRAGQVALLERAGFDVTGIDV